jgi:hypothetical protein
MRLLSALLLTLGLLAPATLAVAAPPGFAFLEIPTGARAAALGGAYASMATGVEAAFWNPARLATAHGLEITGAHSELFQKLRHDSFALGGKMFGGGIAASLRALYSEPIDERDDLGNLIGSFGAHDLELALGYGHEVAPGVSLGGSASIVRERISNLAAMTYAMGLGAAWEPAGLPGLRLALAGQNFGPAASYTIDGVQGAPVSLPAAVQSGVSYRTDVSARMHVVGAVEGRAARGRNVLGLVGAEVGDASGAALRLGLRLNDTATTMSFGAGYALPGFTFDYAFVPLRYELGETHRFGFSTRF